VAATPAGVIEHSISWSGPDTRLKSLFDDVRSRADFMTATISPHPITAGHHRGADW
jgi:hypothetical protein